MRKALFIFVALLLAVSACTERSKGTIHRLLKQADGWVYTSPDTVLHLLKGLTEKDLQNKDDYYYYYLLGAEACMKKHYGSYDTLAIGRTARHYEKGRDQKMLARAYRLWGYAYQSIQTPRCHTYLDKSIGYAR